MARHKERAQDRRTHSAISDAQNRGRVACRAPGRGRLGRSDHPSWVARVAIAASEHIAARAEHRTFLRPSLARRGGGGGRMARPLDVRSHAGRRLRRSASGRRPVLGEGVGVQQALGDGRRLGAKVDGSRAQLRSHDLP